MNRIELTKILFDFLELWTGRKVDESLPYLRNEGSPFIDAFVKKVIPNDTSDLRFYAPTEDRAEQSPTVEYSDIEKDKDVDDYSFNVGYRQGLRDQKALSTSMGEWQQLADNIRQWSDATFVGQSALGKANHLKKEAVMNDKKLNGFNNGRDVTDGIGGRIYVFFREDAFYPIEMKNDAEAIANAEINKGTIKVEDINGRVVWIDQEGVVK